MDARLARRCAILLGFFAWGVSADENPVRSAMAGDQRSEEHRARDAARHPAETLEFFGFRPDLRVVELWPGSGWYTEILAPALRERGALVVASYGEESEPDYRPRSHRALLSKFREAPEVYSEVEVVVLDPPETTRLADPSSVDLILTFRNSHNWVSAGHLDAVYGAAFDALRPGGVLGVVQHRSLPDADPVSSATRGYVPEAYLVEALEAQGFRLQARSDINANPRDTKDYPGGVWTLPPLLFTQEGEDPERFRQIGESDRMTLRFVKPAEDPDAHP